MEKEQCPCGTIDVIDNMEMDDNGIWACKPCATELKIEHIAEQGINNQNLN